MASQIWMDIVEALYAYKSLPFIFPLHLLIIGLLGTYLIFLSIRYNQLSNLQSGPSSLPSKCHTHIKYIDYRPAVNLQTQKELKLLQESNEYQRYIRERDSPTSKYNRKMDEIEEIVFSDQEDERKNQRKYKTM